ncbi:66 kDa U4/U6.U5 small nuclear ribonucleoprotein component [Monosporozyma unispora]|nr:hypothetical protein C6P44_000511 [Kazachstania unispora]
MAGEISLSLKETNKLRIQLGLKPILENPKKQEITKETKSEEVPADNDINFIAKDKVSMLRNKLSKLNQKISLHQDNIVFESSSKDGSTDNWLNSLGQRKPNTNKVKLNHYVDEEGEEEEGNDDLPIMQVSHDIRSLSKGKSTILTLKETSIDNDEEDGENDDILEDEDMRIQEQTAKNLNLRNMNKDRRRKKMTLQVSSKDIDQDEENNELKQVQNTIVVGAEIQTNENIEKAAAESQSSVSSEGKIRVVFDNDSDEEDATDFKPVKIKKRKRKGEDQSSSRKKQNIKLPSQIETVNLNDDDEDDESLNDIIIPQRKTMSKRVNLNNEEEEEDIGLIIRRENLEKEERLKSLNKVQSIQNNGLTIDETTTFFDSLNSSILNDKNSIELPSEDIIKEQKEALIEPQTIESRPNTIPQDLIPKPKVDFYNGLASTLNFLKSHNILPKKENISPPNISNSPDTKEEDGDHSDGTLEHYNPTINIEYKDAYGNKLTTREAYKKLSQKFHGTKSNKKKQLKFDQRVKDRNRSNRS